MPNPLISQITLPNGNTYDIKDAWARQQIEAITGGSAIVFKGVSSTALTDGGNENPTVDGTAVTDKTIGDLYFYNKEEFIYGDDNKWHSLGPQLQTLGALAYKDNATTTYTPVGSVSQPTFTGAQGTVTITATNNTTGNYTPAGTVSGGIFTGSNSTFTGTYTPAGTVTVTTNGTTNKTATVSSTTGTATYTPGGTVSTPTISVNTAGSTASIKQVNAVTDMVSALATAAPGATAPANAITYFSVANENLSLYQIGATKAAPITTTTTTVKTGDASYKSSAPTFTGTGARLVTGNIPVPNTYTATFAGEEDTISTSGTPNGSVSNISFSGQKVQISGTTTPSGTVSKPTFTGTQATITVS